MRNGLLAVLASLAASASLATAQAPTGAPSPIPQTIAPLPQAPIAPAPAAATSYAPAACDAWEPQCCDNSYRLWGSAEYLLWWIKDSPVPVPLVTRGNIADALPGVPGQPGTSTLFGRSSTDMGTFSGSRLTAGYWLDCDQTIGIEASGFLLEKRAVLFSAISDPAGNPFIGRPFFDLLTSSQFPFSSAFPGSLSGGDTVSVTSRLWGAEANAVFSPFESGGALQTRLLAGFRYLDLDEALNISENSVALGNLDLTFLGVNATAGSRANDADRFQTRNQFYGGQIGARTVYSRGAGYLNLGAKLGLGATHQSATIDGFSTLTTPGIVPQGAVGGVLAVPSNSGRFTRNAFSFVPELEARVGYQITRRMGAFIGYNFLYWDNVLRPGDQIPTNGALAVTNRSQIPTSAGFGQVAPPGPATVLNQSDFWAQGVNFGIEFRY